MPESTRCLTRELHEVRKDLCGTIHYLQSLEKKIASLGMLVDGLEEKQPLSVFPDLSDYQVSCF